MVILPFLERELGLQEQVVPGQQAALDRGRDGPTNCGLIVMSALVGGIDTPEALPKGEVGQPLRLLLLPGGPVQEGRHSNAIDRQCPFVHAILRA
jgi:hypothetical protein